MKGYAREMILRCQQEYGAPGISLAVHKNGRPLWVEGFGYADVENMMPMSPRHVLRIASISKSLTTLLVGRAVDQGQLDVHAPIQRYLPAYPRPAFDGEQVDMTIDQLVTHRGGIRHYCQKHEVEEIKKKAEKLRKNKLAHVILSEDEANKSDGSVEEIAKNERVNKREGGEKDNAMTVPAGERMALKKMNDKVKKSSDQREIDRSDFQFREFRTQTKYDSVGDALSVFKDDELVHKPGSDYHYSTHGFTLVSAVLEAATQTKFSTLLKQMFHALDLRDTFLDENAPIVRHRARYYVHGSGGRLQNAPHVDNSWKWAGGGLLSTPADLCRFADTVLYSWQADETASPAGYLRPATARWLWTAGRPRGVTVAIIANVEGMSLALLAEDIARLFAGPD
ncbi:serine beta-lactamase-like protein LACTB, mitochondrial [Pollicipes pollicipes]|uniref:serine beta-lactamase-like protein LACTB, mitochondrial n=1 Tax=Pollicipes pollicipes TaxID=41117 RepID=UPI001884ED4C|nr:serine beta-lactamase-like protein LACTB, mitochondrial [Pollicipes pollicipes]